MKLFLSISLFVLPTLSIASCETLLANKIEEMNFGKRNNLRCGVLKKDENNKLRISMSVKKGRKDLGPTLSFDKRDSSNLVLTQLFSKNKLTKHRHRMKAVMGADCKEYKTVSYTLGTLQSDLTQKRCDDYPNSFNDDELVNLAIGKICEQYFPEKNTEMIQTLDKSREEISIFKE